MNLRTALTALSTLSLGALLATGAAAANLKVPQQFATIQSAVDAAAPGDKIRIADGVYDETVVVDQKSDLTIRGGDDVFVHRMRILSSERVDVEEITFTDSGTQLTIDESSRIGVRSCAFVDGSTAVDLFFTTDCTIEDCKVRNMTVVGIFVVASLDCTIRNVRTRNSTGIHLRATATVIEDCVLKDDFIFADESPSTTIRNNVLKKANILLEDCPDALVEGNTLTKPIEGHKPTKTFGTVPSAPSGIVLHGCTGTTVRSNAVKKAFFNGLVLDGSSEDNLIHGNKVKKSNGDGIRVDGKSNTIAQNTSRKNDALDLRVKPNANTLEGNIFDTANF